MKALRARLPALRSSDYNWFLGGSMISFAGDWMDWVAVNWLVLELTNSPFAIGVYNFFRATPALLLTLPGGLVADRYGRRQIMMVNQIGAMLLTGLLAAFVVLHWETFWLIIAVTTFRGAFITLDRPARQALVPNLVPATAITSAVALFATFRNTSRIVGPAVGGIILGLWGVKVCLLVNSLTYLPVLLALLMIRERSGPSRRPGTMRHGMVEAARYLRGRPIILVLITLAIVPMFFGQPYTTLLPMFARDLLQVGATGLGFLLSAAAAGAVLGALGVALWGDRPRGGRVLLGSIFLFGLSLVSFAFSRWFPLSLFLVFVAGLLHQVYATLNVTLLQGAIPDALRGRIMSVHSLSRGFIPLGAFFLGSLASLVGLSVALASMAGVCMLLALVLSLGGSALADLKGTHVSLDDAASLPETPP